jgi:hypothetical protein
MTYLPPISKLKLTVPNALFSERKEKIMDLWLVLYWGGPIGLGMFFIGLGVLFMGIAKLSQAGKK